MVAPLHGDSCVRGGGWGGCAHRSGDGADGILESLFKGAFFALQALQFARTGTYPRTKAELACLLEGDEARILAVGRDWDSHRPADDGERRDLVDLLLRWSEGVMLLGSRRTGPEKHPSVDVEIREATPEEWALLPDFTYEAIFKRPEDGFIPRTVLQHPALEGYYQGFGSGKADRCLVAVADGAVVGAIWARAAAGYGSVDAETPELAMSLYSEWRGMGIGSRLLDAMLRIAEGEGWERVSLSVQLDNFAHGMYLKAGFEPVEIRGGEAVMVKRMGRKRGSRDPPGLALPPLRRSFVPPFPALAQMRFERSMLRIHGTPREWPCRHLGASLSFSSGAILPQRPRARRRNPDNAHSNALEGATATAVSGSSRSQPR